MRRRGFIALVGSAAVWPAAHAQQPNRIARWELLKGQQEEYERHATGR